MTRHHPELGDPRLESPAVRVTLIGLRDTTIRARSCCSICSGATTADLIADVLHLDRGDPVVAEMAAAGATVGLHSSRWDVSPGKPVTAWSWINTDSLAADYERAKTAVAARTRDKPCGCCGRTTLARGETWTGRHCTDGMCSTCGTIRQQWANLGISLGDVAVAFLLGTGEVAPGLATFVGFGGFPRDDQGRPVRAASLLVRDRRDHRGVAQQGAGLVSAAATGHPATALGLLSSRSHPRCPAAHIVGELDTAGVAGRGGGSLGLRASTRAMSSRCSAPAPAAQNEPVPGLAGGLAHVARDEGPADREDEGCDGRDVGHQRQQRVARRRGVRRLSDEAGHEDRRDDCADHPVPGWALGGARFEVVAHDWMNGGGASLVAGRPTHVTSHQHQTRRGGPKGALSSGSRPASGERRDSSLVGGAEAKVPSARPARSASGAVALSQEATKVSSSRIMATSASAMRCPCHRDSLGFGTSVVVVVAFVTTGSRVKVVGTGVSPWACV